MTPAADHVALGSLSSPIVFSLLSPLLNRTRAAVLMLLLVVLPLQSVVQLLAGLQGPRHMHSDSVHAVASPSPLRLLLDHLHAVHAPRLKVFGSSATAGELHEHGGAYHRHTHDTAEAIDVHDTPDDAAPGGATAFLAWMPGMLPLADTGAGDARPTAAELDWRDRIVAPPLMPPRG